MRKFETVDEVKSVTAHEVINISGRRNISVIRTQRKIRKRRRNLFPGHIAGNPMLNPKAQKLRERKPQGKKRMGKKRKRHRRRTEQMAGP